MPHSNAPVLPPAPPSILRTIPSPIVLDPSDDGSSDAITLQTFELGFNGQSHNTIFVNNNGNITFDFASGDYKPQLEGNIIMPFGADVVTGQLGTPDQVEYGEVDAAHFDGQHNAFIATWDHVGHYFAGGDEGDSPDLSLTNTFQVALIDRSDISPGAFDIEFNYQSIQWDSTQVYGAGILNSLDETRAGYALVTGGEQSAVPLPGSGVEGAFLDGNETTALIHGSNCGLDGRFVFHVWPPVAYDSSNVSVRTGATTPIDPLQNAQDFDGNIDPATFQVVSGPAHGQVNVYQNKGLFDSSISYGQNAINYVVPAQSFEPTSAPQPYYITLGITDWYNPNFANTETSSSELLPYTLHVKLGDGDTVAYSGTRQRGTVAYLNIPGELSGGTIYAQLDSPDSIVGLFTETPDASDNSVNGDGESILYADVPATDQITFAVMSAGSQEGGNTEASTYTVHVQFPSDSADGEPTVITSTIDLAPGSIGYVSIPNEQHATSLAAWIDNPDGTLSLLTTFEPILQSHHLHSLAGSVIVNRDVTLGFTGVDDPYFEGDHTQSGAYTIHVQYAGADETTYDGFLEPGQVNYLTIPNPSLATSFRAWTDDPDILIGHFVITTEFDYTSTSAAPGETPFVGTDSFTFTVQDTQGLPAVPATFTINVVPNQAPIAADDTVIAVAGQPMYVYPAGNDYDNDGYVLPDSMTIISGPTSDNPNFSPDQLQSIGYGEYIFRPPTGFVGTVTFTYTVKDDSLESSNVATVKIIVNPPDVFFKGDHLEIGVNGAGSLGSVAIAPEGYHPSGNGWYDFEYFYGFFGQSGLGLVYNPSDNPDSPQWSNDLLLAGTPEEGWGVQAQGTDSFDNFPLEGMENVLPISLVFSQDGDVQTAVWTGREIFGSSVLEITQTINFNVHDKFFVFNVDLKNVGAAPIDGLKYFRTVDPDLDPSYYYDPYYGYYYYSFDTATSNYILHPEDVGATGDGTIGVARARGSNLSFGLGVNDPRAVVSVNGAFNRNPDDISNASSPPTQDDPAVGNYHLGLAFDLGSLAAGESTSIHYAYILSSQSDPTSEFTAALSQVPTGSGTSTQHGPYAILASKDEVGLGSEFSLPENQPATLTLSTSDYDAGETQFTYSFFSGQIVTDYGPFHLVGNELHVDALDFETQASYLVPIYSTDSAGHSTSTNLTIDVTDVNDRSTDITLSATSFAENQSARTLIASITTQDPDTGDSFSYGLSFDDHFTGDFPFYIQGDKLYSNISFDFEQRSSYGFTIVSTDEGGSGLSFDKHFVLTILDANDPPVAGTPLTSSTSQNDPAYTLDLDALFPSSVSDPDVGDALHITRIVYVSGDTQGVRIEIGDQGDFKTTHLHVDPSAYKYLAAGQSTDVVYSFTVTDSHGASVNQTETITITGTNDPAVLSSDTRNLTEGDTAGAISSNGNLAITDIDGPPTFIAQPGTVGKYGTFVIAASGAWTYTASSAHNEFMAGTTYADVFSATASDGTTTTVTINITGTNDAAILSSATKNLIESNTASSISSSGMLTISDVDSPETFVAQPSAMGSYGSFTVNASGAWTYTASSAHDEFAAGAMYTDSFVVTSADGTRTSVMINIAGTNDPAVLSSDVRNLTETNSAADISSSGTLTISDVDSPQTFVAQAHTLGQYGTLIIDTSGAWTYTATSAQDQFVAGITYTDTFSVSAADGTATTVTINILGTNDPAVMSSEERYLTESNSAALLSANGSLTISDVDSTQVFILQPNTVGTYGTFFLATNGFWTWNASSAHDEFVAGTTYTDTFTASSFDGTTTTVTIHILGTNDAAVLSSDTANLIETNAALSSSGTLTVSDVDSPATFVAQPGTVGLYGTFIIDAAGAWTYATSSAHDEFVAGTTYTDTFSVSSFDGTMTSVTINILGTNDPAILSPVTKLLFEGNSAADISSSGRLTISDVDSPQIFVAQESTAGSYGTFGIGIDGVWTYTASSAHNEFVGGGSYTDTFIVSSADGTLTSVTINIRGTNDAAVLSSDTKNVTETNSAIDISCSGVLTISDADSPATFAVQNNTAGNYGSFSINAAGAWTYTASSAHDEFVAGATYTDTFQVSSADGTTTTVTINILGTNDSAVVSSDTENLFESNSATDISSNGKLTISDVDNFPVFADQGETVGKYGSFIIHPDGTWSYTASSAHDEFMAGMTYTDTFSVSAADGTTTSVTINIVGTNDPAVLVSATVSKMEGDTAAAISASGVLSISDVDSPATFVVQANTAGNYGTFSISVDGVWTYTANSAHDEFVAGTTYTDTFSVSSFDGTMTSVTINILGTNDAAVLSSATANLIETNAALSSSGTLTVSDVDSPATFVAQPGTVGNYGNFTIDATGHWTYATSSAHDEFMAGTTYTDTFSVSSSDGTMTSVTIHILGTNDAAVLSSATANLIETNAALSSSGMLTVSDVDSPATFVAQPGTVGNYGNFTIDATGHWTYATSSAHDEFVAGTTYTDTFSVSSSDGTMTSVTIHILGTNDAAVLSSATANLIETNAPLSTSGTLSISDPDSDASFVAQSGVVGAYGTFAIGADGVWTYSALSAHDEFAARATYTETFDVISADGTHTSVTINIAGSNDAPTATNLSQTKTYPKNASLVVFDDIVITDPDAADTVTATLTLANSVAGNLNFNDAAQSNGVWSITGTVAAVNDALTRVTFVPTVGNTVNTFITVHIEDAAGTGPSNGVISLNVFSPKQIASTADSGSSVVTQDNSSTQADASSIVGSTPVNVSATLKGDAGATLYVAVYVDNPISGDADPTTAPHTILSQSRAADNTAQTTVVMPVAFYDVRIEKGTSATLTFSVDVDTETQARAITGLLYYDGTNWAPVTLTDQHTIPKATIVQLDGLNGKWRVSFIYEFDSQSTPTIDQLKGTVFTLAIPVSTTPTPTPVDSPQAALTFVPPAVASFSSSEQVTLVLRTSNTTDLSSSHTETASGTQTIGITTLGSGGAVDEEAAGDNPFDIGWLLRMLETDENPNTTGRVRRSQGQSQATPQAAPAAQPEVHIPSSFQESRVDTTPTAAFDACFVGGVLDGEDFAFLVETSEPQSSRASAGIAAALVLAGLHIEVERDKKKRSGWPVD